MIDVTLGEYRAIQRDLKQMERATKAASGAGRG